MNQRVFDRLVDEGLITKEAAPGWLGRLMKRVGSGIGALQKVPAPPRTHQVTPFGKALGYGGGGALALGATHGASNLYEKSKEKKDAKSGWKAMMAKNPDLRKMDQRKLKDHYRVLAKFNPEMATEPTVSGSFVRQTMQRSDLGVDPNQIKQLVGIRKDYISSRGGGKGGGNVGGALRALGGALS
jgi:hypothetical protein